VTLTIKPCRHPTAVSEPGNADDARIPARLAVDHATLGQLRSPSQPTPTVQGVACRRDGIGELFRFGSWLSWHMEGSSGHRELREEAASTHSEPDLIGN
jgi:hypothetical protein